MMYFKNLWFYSKILKNFDKKIHQHSSAITARVITWWFSRFHYSKSTRSELSKSGLRIIVRPLVASLWMILYPIAFPARDLHGVPCPEGPARSAGSPPREPEKSRFLGFFWIFSKSFQGLSMSKYRCFDTFWVFLTSISMRKHLEITPERSWKD